jgi:hypothetical protein
MKYYEILLILLLLLLLLLSLLYIQYIYISYSHRQSHAKHVIAITHSCTVTATPLPRSVQTVEEHIQVV